MVAHRFVYSFFVRLFTTLTALIFISQPSYAAGGNDGGHEGSGGGGVLVCFAESTEPAKIESLKIAEPPSQDGNYVDVWRASTKYRIIPDSMLRDIASIELLELVQAKILASTLTQQRVPEIYNPLLLPNLNAPVNLQTAATRDLDLINLAANSYVERFAQALPRMVSSYRFASQILNIENLKPLTAGELENTIQDFVTVAMQPPPKNCVVSSMMVQSGHGVYSHWQVDERLFYHSKHTFISQVATLLHERAYWMFRASIVAAT